MKTLAGTRKAQEVRTGIQIVFFLYVLLLSAAHTLGSSGPLSGFADLHALCPFGAVETLGRLITQGRFVPKTQASNLWVFAAVAISTALFGSLFCGWLCPLGSVQEWAGRLGKKLLGKKYNRFPRRLDRLLGYMRYLVLAVIMIQTTRLLTLTFARLDPYYALFHFASGQALPGALIVLALVLAASLLVERPWCRWFCPLGAVLGLIQRISPWKIRRRENCSGCGSAARRCALNVEVCAGSKVVDTRCNRCGRCLSACPVSGCLDHALPGRRAFSLKSRFLTAALTLCMFAAPIAAVKIGGFWGGSAAPAPAELSADRIDGALSLEELARGFGTTPENLKDFLGLPAEVSGSTRLRDIEDVVEDLTTPLIRERMRTFSPS
jgi:polyferredoxin